MNHDSVSVYFSPQIQKHILCCMFSCNAKVCEKQTNKQAQPKMQNVIHLLHRRNAKKVKTVVHKSVGDVTAG